MKVSILFGLLFSPVAGAMAYLITYQEYRRHFASRKPAIRAALEAGLITLAFFLLLAAAAGAVIDRIGARSGAR